MVDAALLEHDPRHRQYDRLPRSAHRREPVAAGRLAGDDDHRIADRPHDERAPVERRHPGAAEDERGDGDAPGGHPQTGRIAHQKRRQNEERAAERGDGKPDRGRHHQPGMAGHSVTCPCRAASLAGPMPLTASSSSSERNPPCSVR